MARRIGSVTVQLQGGTEQLGWADNLNIDRKGKLHVYGAGRQHRVYDDGEWKGFLVAPTKLPNSIAGD